MAFRVDQWHTPSVTWLAALPASDADALRRASTVQTYRRGESVFGPAREPDYVCLLEEGLVRIYRVSPAGREFTVGFVRPGELFGEVSVMSDKPRESFAEAKLPSRILRMPRAAFVTMLRTHNPVLYEVTKRIAERLVKCQSRAEDLLFLDTRARLARLLVRLAREHGRQDGAGTTLGLPLTQQELATLVGATRQTVNDLLREMVAVGLVERRRRQLFLPNPTAIEAIGWPGDRSS